MFSILTTVLFLAPLISANCPLPADPTCLVKNAQYTILGTVVSNNIGQGTYNTTQGTMQNYNASIAVQCVWASFISPPSTGFGLVNTIVPVTGFGVPHAGCPNNGGAEAVVNTTQIFLLHFTSGVLGGPNYYSVSNPCAGNIDYTNENVQLIANLLGASPGNKIAAQYMGTNSQCTLPAANKTVTSTLNSPKPVLNLANPPSGTLGNMVPWISVMIFLVVSTVWFV